MFQKLMYLFKIACVKFGLFEILLRIRRINKLYNKYMFIGWYL